MFAKRVKLTNFRNYESADIEFTSGVNLIYGPNGQGKTNLVEALNFFAGLDSHRVAGHTPLIKQGESTAIISLDLSHKNRDLLLEYEINTDSSNRARLNKSEVAKPKDILGYLNSVIFAPEDLDIVKRDPSNRRAFLDQLIVQFNPRMHGVYADYDRVLKQRNTLLKSARATGTKGDSLSTLDAWDQALVKNGTEIIAARVSITKKLSPSLVTNYQNIAITNNQPTIFIRSSVVESSKLDQDDLETQDALEKTNKEEISELFQQKLSLVRPKEIERGITLVGPHRDDLQLNLGSLPAKGYASHGESWSYALSLKLASLEILKSESKLGDPILILDDVFAELDKDRRQKLSDLVQQNEQVLITAAVIEDVPGNLLANKFQVESGRVTHA
jgi:DNA replication and repair protein RecF